MKQELVWRISRVANVFNFATCVSELRKGINCKTMLVGQNARKNFFYGAKTIVSEIKGGVGVDSKS